MSSLRDYNKEHLDNERQYFYGFDNDVMHPYMLKSIIPFIKTGNLLELGSYKGAFTKLCISHFNSITCIEASSDALYEAKALLGDSVNLINSRFENIQLSEKYNNVIMAHVLEHLDDPVSVLKRINKEWLSKDGRFFLICPNANAPSRQIAVKMGLISHNSAVTKAEALHGHRITYSLDTLEHDATLAGLNVIYRTGIFFKALANFQWDKLLKTDIISNEYLDGCFKLGQQYPDLCSSIMLVCEKGK
ncbi:MAG: class I SAM-dependent methyltransferase [Bacteroidales bacterium]